MGQASQANHADRSLDLRRLDVCDTKSAKNGRFEQQYFLVSFLPFVVNTWQFTLSNIIITFLRWFSYNLRL